ncbi:putative cyclase [Minicystis rosea]|nr:putative cyclase [Minicystis rosea]
MSNPHAREAERQVIAWFEGLGCTKAELARARRFDVAGYVGIPFPTIPLHKTIQIGKYLSLWLLWDDVEVETLDDRWVTDAEHVLAQRRPAGMNRFDEGWWDLLTGFAASRSPRWIQDLCRAMMDWNAAAVEEAEIMAACRQHGEPPPFERQLEMRVATIGMYATVYLLEDAYDIELPRDFHAHPTVLRLKWLANEIVGLGNDILSFGKDYTESQINLVTTLMYQRGVSVDDAIAHLVHMHDEALLEYDRLAESLHGWPPDVMAVITRWLQDVRYASLGFSLWESQAPRYTAYKVVTDGRVIEPRFSFFPPQPSERPHRTSEPPTSRRPSWRPSRNSVPPSSRHGTSTVEHS